jgi:hypothetical protein
MARPGRGRSVRPAAPARIAGVIALPAAEGSAQGRGTINDTTPAGAGRPSTRHAILRTA